LNTKSFSSVGLSVAACALAATVALTARVTVEARPQAPATAADDPGAALFVKMCSDCHDSKRVVSQRRTTAEWEDTLRKMIEEGAEGSEKDFEGVFNYLVRNYGKVFINSGKATEIKNALGLTDADAQAIVAYRTANGPFADFDGVKKVPSIDVKKLDEHKEAVAF
jgi:competence protein ComEA